MKAKSLGGLGILLAAMFTSSAWAGVQGSTDAQSVCASSAPATSGPLTRQQVVDQMRQEKANGCWELSQFHYPAPYDTALRAHVIAMQQERPATSSQ